MKTSKNNVFSEVQAHLKFTFTKKRKRKQQQPNVDSAKRCQEFPTLWGPNQHVNSSICSGAACLLLPLYQEILNPIKCWKGSSNHRDYLTRGSSRGCVSSVSALATSHHISIPPTGTLWQTICAYVQVHSNAAVVVIMQQSEENNLVYWCTLTRRGFTRRETLLSSLSSKQHQYENRMFCFYFEVRNGT